MQLRETESGAAPTRLEEALIELENVETELASLNQQLMWGRAEARLLAEKRSVAGAVGHRLGVRGWLVAAVGVMLVVDIAARALG